MFDCFRCLNPCKSKQHKAEKLQKKVVRSEDNVKVLLECEEKGKEIVARARERQNRRNVEAKDVATKQINKLRQECEKKFNEFSAGNDKVLERMKTEVAEEISTKIKKINEQAKANKQTVLDMLINNVMKIEPRVHPNLNVLRKKQDLTASTQTISNLTDSTQSFRP